MRLPAGPWVFEVSGPDILLAAVAALDRSQSCPSADARTPAPWTVRLDGPTPLPAPESPAVAWQAGSHQLAFATRFAAGSILLDEGAATVVVGAPDATLADLGRRVYGALRLLLLLKAHESGGLCLHGCALAPSPRAAFALLGASGAGKTTLTSVHGSTPRLSDDLVLLTGPSGAPLRSGDPIVAWGHPFSGREGAKATADSAELAWWGGLRQATHASRAPLRPPDALHLALTHAFHVRAELSARAALLARAQVLAALPCFDVAWDRRPAPWAAPTLLVSHFQQEPT